MSSLPRRDGRKHCGLADGLPWPPGSASPLCPRASVARQHCFRHALHWGFAPPRLALSYLCNRLELFLVLICCVFVRLCVSVFVRLCVAVWVGALALVWAARFEAEWAAAKKP